ncbi:methyltransferase family protein [Fulvivirga sediminis]|uniref:Isoprenylcysteine carboxylmethyltransferase family protein n=1 Tax=Fulvivirga sediminis TaxID=2803949 RepID=A0A937F629_9BACT|nr:isoprenylcysteine carboxylmethyltransferase family protein [Fulvivirga sediminis]MBL3654919.1 isoprenylcysteine carboxylmethyltransferase family protein [Fulvivirga sediminis]
MPLYIHYLLLVLGWLVYFVLHTGLASLKVKGNIINTTGLSQAAYRICYNIIALIGILVLLFYNGTLVSPKLIPQMGVVKYVSLFSAGVGVIIINAAFKQYSTSGFLGLAREESGKLKTKGILSYIRHPLYIATILIFIGFFLYDSRLATLISVLCVFVYLPVGIYLEEKKLIKIYGDEYRAYKKRVPALIPFYKTILDNF